MEINFQPQKDQCQYQYQYQPSTPTKKPTKPKQKQKSSKKSSSSCKFLGVRQRPSGRWVAEIKDTTQKIRMWLGTFETAEEAARAYDEAACLLRGTNTRTNFAPAQQLSPDSPLASRIRMLLNHKRLKNSLAVASNVSSSAPAPSPSPSPSNANVVSPSNIIASNMALNPFESALLGYNNYCNINSSMIDDQNATLLDDACFANGGDDLAQLPSNSNSLMDQTWLHEPADFDPFAFELPESSNVGSGSLSESDRMKLHEYFEKVLFDQHDPAFDYANQICHLPCRT